LVIGKGGTKRQNGKRGMGRVGEEVWGMLNFGWLVSIWVYFCCCGGGYLCHVLQRAGVVYGWYNRLSVCGECVGGRSWTREGGGGEDRERE
jgi:hypothetical protein